MGKLGDLMTLVDADEAMPGEARQVLGALFGQCRALEESVATLEAKIVAHARRADTARRLATVPGIGPITSSLIAATAQTSGFAEVADIGVFQSARHFAA